MSFIDTRSATSKYLEAAPLAASTAPCIDDSFANRNSREFDDGPERVNVQITHEPIKPRNRIGI